MQEIKGLVSIIIPAYNAVDFIGETLQSICDQTHDQWKVWVIDDGSTDNTSAEVRKFSDSRISLLSQENGGVSSARNKGLKASNGEFIVFFDADDLMTPDFLETRVQALSNNKEVGFVGGWVESFPVKSKMKKATAEDPEGDIHFFNANAVTIPSNYMFRGSVIREHGIEFNPALNSSADRFFLLQVAKNTKGRSLDDEKGKLLYRVSETSMSHHVTPKLIRDYYKLYKELNIHDLLPQKKRREIKTRYLFSIASGFAKVKNWGASFKLLFRSFFIHPVVFFRLAVSRKYRNINK